MTEPSEAERRVLRRMKDDWNARARSDAYCYIASAENPGEAEFRASGARDVALFFRGLEHLLTPDTTVLDIGCGIGRMDEHVAPRLRRLIGVDVSGEMVARARARLAHLPNVEFRENDGFGLPGMEGSIDLVFSHIVFQHVPGEVMDAYFRSAWLVLRPGGSLVFQVPEWIDRAPAVPPIDDTWELRFYLEDDLRGRLGAIGFQWVGVERFRVESPKLTFTHLRVHVRKPWNRTDGPPSGITEVDT